MEKQQLNWRSASREEEKASESRNNGITMQNLHNTKSLKEEKVLKMQNTMKDHGSYRLEEESHI